MGHLYRLTETVKNPIVDRRSANPMLRLPELEAGTYFVCLTSDDHPDLVELKHGSYRGREGTFTVGIRQKDGTLRGSKYENNQKWSDAIVPHLEEAPIEGWTDIVRAFGTNSFGAILRELWEEGMISHERLLELLRKHTVGAGIL